jgi:hypothetical protein
LHVVCLPQVPLYHRERTTAGLPTASQQTTTEQEAERRNSSPQSRPGPLYIEDLEGSTRRSLCFL